MRTESCPRECDVDPEVIRFIRQGGELMKQNCPLSFCGFCWDLVQCSSPVSTRGCNLCITELQGELTLTHIHSSRNSVTLIITLTQ